MVEAQRIKIPSAIFYHFADVTALKGLTLDIYQNEIFTIIGPANSGKIIVIAIIESLE